MRLALRRSPIDSHLRDGDPKRRIGVWLVAGGGSYSRPFSRDRSFRAACVIAPVWRINVTALAPQPTFLLFRSLNLGYSIAIQSVAIQSGTLPSGPDDPRRVTKV